MAVTEVARFGYRLAGRGMLKHGIYALALDSYVNGTGFILSASDFGLARLVQLMIQPVNCEGVMFDWNPSTGALKAYTANATEAANDALDGMSVRITYWGF